MNPEGIFPINIEDELRTSYLDYAMSVIVGRALPDVRDGLKPVHRRVLFAMNELASGFDKPYKKSARIVGDVLGKYHPHGDTAVYDTIVRMAQPFSLRYMLVDGQGNFGSVDGDSAAAMRYTEIRMSKIAHELLEDLQEDTVDYVDNYDGTQQIPSVMPTRLPNLLINGSSGIAVGMATNIPPHNLGEVVNGCLAYLDNENITVAELMQYIPGPDFPTGGTINGLSGIEEAYNTGRGKIYLRAKAYIEVDDRTNRETIIVYQLPYQVNKAKLVEKIHELAKEGRLTGISGLRDESDKEGMRISIDVKRDAVGEIVLNNLFSMTQMQVTFGINMVALHRGQPMVMSLKGILNAFIRHRKEVVTRRTIHRLGKAQARGRTLEALAVARINIKEIISIIQNSATPAEAKTALLNSHWSAGALSTLLLTTGNLTRDNQLQPGFGFDPVTGKYTLSSTQADDILELRLMRLTGMEYDKILEEYNKQIAAIHELVAILENPEQLTAVIRGELIAARDEYQDQRRTEISHSSADINLADLIPEQDVVVTLSHLGYIKYQPTSDYEAQRRGGRGKTAVNTKEEDYVYRLLVANTHDTILCFSNVGKVYWLKVYELPMASGGSRGKPIVNLLPIGDGEQITAILPVKEFDETKYVFMATRYGTVKKTALAEFSRPRNSGIIALGLADGNELIGVDLVDDTNDIMLFSSNGKVVRFCGSQVRPMGRTATGIKGIELLEDDTLVSMVIPRGEGEILTVTKNGYGKRTPVSEYPAKSRATQGVISIKVSERNGKVVGSLQVTENDELLIITDAGVMIRSKVGEITSVGRNTQGVLLIRVGEGQSVSAVERVEGEVWTD